MQTTTVRASSRTTVAVAAYAVVVLGTLVALAVLSAAHSPGATTEGWVHTAIVAVLGVLLLARLRSARRGQRGGLVAVGVIAVVLLVANLVEAVLPGVFVPWMRIEMVAIAALMAVLAVSVRQDLRVPSSR